MKVLLVDPPQLFLTGAGHTRQVQPLGLAYVGAYLEREGHAVRFLLPDTFAYQGEDPWGELAAQVTREAPDVVGLTAVTATYSSARCFAEMVKAVDPGIKVVLGGVHASSEPIASILGCDAIDFVIKGEGEQTMAALLEVCAAGGAVEALSGVLGLVYRDGEGRVRQNDPRPSIEELDSLPMPLRENLVYTRDIQPAFYQAAVTLRGCPYRCIYCAVPSSSNRLTRYRSPEHVVEEIAQLRERYDIPYLFFHDSVFTLHRDRTLEICRGMIARGLEVPFACQTRADRVDGDLLDVMKAAGCHQIFFGIESGDVRSLKLLRKKMTLERIREAVDEVKARSIRCTGFFMVGFPWETAELIEQTVNFACELGLDAISLFSATPLPGTELWDMTSAQKMPDAIDFRTPQVNLTSMTDSVYADVFTNAKDTVDAFNQRRMYESLQPRASPATGQGVMRDWLDG